MIVINLVQPDDTIYRQRMRIGLSYLLWVILLIYQLNN